MILAMVLNTMGSHLREFVKTHVILAPVREFSRSRAASKIPFPGASRARRASSIFYFRY